MNEECSGEEEGSGSGFVGDIGYGEVGGEGEGTGKGKGGIGSVEEGVGRGGKTEGRLAWGS